MPGKGMEKGEGARNDEWNLNQIESAAPARTKKERFWLGYSNENLNAQRNKKKSLTRLRKSNSGLKNRDGEGGYDEPKDYGNVDEVIAPALVDEGTQRKEPHLEDRQTSQPLWQDEGAGYNKYGVSRPATELYTISYLIFFSILGTLARLGLQALTTYPGAPVQTGLLWANVGGSFILGFLSEDQQLFRSLATPDFPNIILRDPETEQNEPTALQPPPTEAPVAHFTSRNKKTIPLYIGLATGFCGSFTSFSSFIRDAFYALSNALPVPINHPSTTTPPSPISPTLNVPRNGGYSFMALLAVLITTLGLSLGALKIGAHLALATEKRLTPISSATTRKIVDRVVVLLALGSWLAALLLAILPPDRVGGPAAHRTGAQETWRSQALFACVFAPLGCLLRFYISIHLNGRIKAFPLGTFAVNIFGSIVEAVCIDLQHAPVGGLIGCQVLQGVEDGFCGCLTTVSTWVAEIQGLRRRHAYVYGGASVAVALGFLVVICGSLMWTQGFVTPLCVT